MALTPFRWAAIAVIGMLAVFIAVMREGRPYEPTAEELSQRELSMRSSHHGRRVGQFVRQYRMAQLTDSLRRAIPASSLAVRTLHVGNVDERIRAAVDSTVGAGRRKVSETPRVPVDVVTLVDTTETAGYRAWSSALIPFYILPERAGERCVVVVPLGNGFNAHQNSRLLYTEDARRQILGPCAYYATFGMPGPAIRAWLRERGALLALGGSWTQTTASLTESVDYNYYLSTDPYYPSPPPAFFQYSPRGVTCLMGDASTCESTVLDRNIETGFMSVGSAVRPGYRLGPISRRTGTEFGGLETELLADMVRALGRARFEQFWTSSAPVPQAFQQASGMRLGEWVSAWAGQPVPKYEPGPRIRAESLISALAIVIGCMVIAGVAARRRVFA
jgi:hypothetical protein